MTTEAGLTLTLLGGFEARAQDDGSALILPTKKIQALVACLALPLGRVHARADLATLLWADMPAHQARGNLRQALSRLRHALPRPSRAALIFDGTGVALDGALVDVDVARFETLAAAGSPESLEQAAQLYRGDLLSGLALSERVFDDWLSTERERLRMLAIQALGRLLTHLQKSADAEPAVQVALRLLTLDPLQESVHRTVMRLYARLGRRSAALRQYQQCADLLKRELRALPEAETARVYQEILSSPAAGRRRRSRGTFPARAAVDASAGDPVHGAALRHWPGSAPARTGANGPGARASGSGVRSLHRGVRDGRPASRARAARRDGGGLAFRAVLELRGT
jgi:DNA-binding SARP family transcriptional activator